MYLDNVDVSKFMKLEQKDFDDHKSTGEKYMECPFDSFAMYLDPNVLNIFKCRKCDRNYCTSCSLEHNPEVLTCEEYKNTLQEQDELDMLNEGHIKEKKY